MALPCFSKANRKKLQRTLKNLRVSLLCFLLTFLVLRNTIGAGKFGTPAQDFEEIRLHLRNVGLPRRHVRVLAEAVGEEKPSLADSESFEQRNAAALAASEEAKARRSIDPAIAVEAGKAVERTHTSWDKVDQRNVGLASLKGMRWNAASLTLDVKHRNVPLLKASNEVPALSISAANKQERSRLSDDNGDTNLGQSPSRGSLNALVLVAAGPRPSSCNTPAERQLLLKSLQNIVEYSRRSGFEFPAIVGAQNSLMKISLLQSMLETHARTEWIWWVPNGALFITDPAFVLPLQSYLEYNIVLLAPTDASYSQEILTINLDTDSFLIRNCQWSFELVQKSAEFSAAGGSGIGMLASVNPQLEKADLLFLNQKGGTSRKEVYVQDSVVLRSKVEGLASKLEMIASSLPAGAAEMRLPFITQLLDCKLCQEGSKGEVEKCFKPMERLLMFADKEAKLQKRGLTSGKRSFMQQVAG